MATGIMERGDSQGFTRNREFLMRRPGTRVSWGAIFSGLFATLGIWALLSAFGSAIGFTVFRMGPGVAREGFGLFSTLWAIMTPLVSFFLGGLVAGRLCGALTRVSGMLHGVVMWSLTGLVAIALGSAVLDLNSLLLTLQTGDRAAGFWLWGLAGAMAISLLAAMVGSALGVTRSEAQAAPPERPLVQRREVVERDLIGATPGPAAMRAAEDRGAHEDRRVVHEREERDELVQEDVVDEGFRARRRSAGAGAAVLAGAGAAGAGAVAARRSEAGDTRAAGVAARAGLEGRQEEVPRERWGDLLEALSELHRDDPIRVEVAGSPEGRRPLITRSPLVGLDFDGGSPGRAIDILVGEGTQVFDHRIESPRHLYFHEDLDRGTADLAIEDAGQTRTLIHFSPAPTRHGLN